MEIVSERAAKIFEDKYPNLLVCFTVGDVFSAIASFFRLGGLPKDAEFTVPNLVKATEEAFKALLMRGALNEFQRVPPPIPDAAQRELDKLFGVEEPDPATDAQAAQNAHKALIDEAARDWRTLGSRDYKAKWMNTDERRAISEEAKLEALDKAAADGFKTSERAESGKLTQ